MNFQQLRIIRETVRRNFNLTEVANALYTSQSGVSKHIKDLEDELGVELFVRKGKRLLGLTDPGKELAIVVDRMLVDANNIRQIADQFSKRDQGSLVIATTHTQARYALPPIVGAFKKEFPRVHLALYQGSPQEIVTQLLAGEADIGIATESLAHVPELVTFPMYEWQHAVVVPADHPLAKKKKVTLEDIAEFPVVTYHEGYTGRTRIDEAFGKAGLVPDVVLSALDADVIKTYVELGLGVGIIASVAFDAARDRGLKLVGAGLFGSNTTRIAVRRGHYLRGFGYRFLKQCAPALTETAVKEALAPQREL
ncbi:MAG: CysB family HTH-type transcriptional regulator [Gammaproteobacteria bacterium]